MQSQPRIGRVTIAPRVLETVARLTTLAVPGVCRISSPPGVQHLLGRDGVRIDVHGDVVCVELYIVTDTNAIMLNVGRQVQAEVTRAIQDIVGLRVGSVNVHIEDVAVAFE